MSNPLPSSAKRLNAPVLLGAITLSVLLVCSVSLSLALGVSWQDIYNYIGDSSQTSMRQCESGTAIFPYWEGEYPGPVVVLDKAQELQVRAKLCDKQATTSCLVKAGMYHPWSQQELNFATLTGIVTYKALVAFRSKTRQYPAGTVVQQVGSLGEGYCLLQVQDDRWAALCPDVPSQSGSIEFEQLEYTKVQTKKFVQVSCGNNQRGWLEVNEKIFDSPTVRRGVITGYGKIAAKKLEK